MTDDDNLGWGIVAANIATSMANLQFALGLRKERKAKEKKK